MAITLGFCLHNMVNLELLCFVLLYCFYLHNIVHGTADFGT